MLRPLTAAAAFILVAGAALAQPETKPSTPATTAAQPTDAAKRPYALMVGDKAPALTVEKWVKGEPITGFEKGRVYVVEFWATWCGPCIAAMPHLSELQKEHKDDGLTIIGMTSVDSRGNTLEAVEAMVEDKGDTMGYTVAWDTERKTNVAYMTAAGQNGIPCSYLIDREGRLAYIGHPMNLDKPLEEVLNGTFNMEKATAAYTKKIANEAKLKPLQRRFGMAAASEKWDDAIAVLDEMEQLDPELAPMLSFQRFNILLEKGDTTAAYAAAAKAIDANKDSAQTLNAISWKIVDPDGDVEPKDLNLALRAADRAVELTKSKDAAILDTLALVYFLKGNTAKAIELQTKAVELADDDMKDELEGRLEEFKAKK